MKERQLLVLVFKDKEKLKKRKYSTHKREIKYIQNLFIGIQSLLCYYFELEVIVSWRQLTLTVNIYSRQYLRQYLRTENPIFVSTLVRSEWRSGINRFVALFAVPLLSFHFIASNYPYEMNYRFIAADSLQKIIVLAVLAVWSRTSARGSLEWSITLFSVSTLPNTLVMGIPLLQGMYGDYSGSLMVQIVVLQCIIWYTLMLFLFEYRGARMLISEQFPDTAGSIVSFRVDSDIISLDGKEPSQTEAQVGEDGKIHVTVRKSTSSRSDIFSRRSHGGPHSGISLTPRPSNLTNAEIYSLQSSRNPTPRGSSFNHSDSYSMVNCKNTSPRQSNFGNLGGFDEEIGHVNQGKSNGGYPAPAVAGIFSPTAAGGGGKKKANGAAGGAWW